MDATSLDIPTLDPALQAESLALPVLPYGAVGRRIATGGTRHFYVADRKFSGLWADPASLLASGCTVAVEPNFSSAPDTPRWQVLSDIARKRTLARHWQRYGVRILVDLNVDPAFRDLALLGVPRFWGAYATRSHRGISPDAILDDYRLARDHSESKSILFVLVGGGRRARQLATLNGWAFVPEHSHVARGIVAPYGEGIA